MTTVVNYDDVLIDLNYFEQKINNDDDYESEIILLPGNYKTKLSYVNNVKNKETLNAKVDIFKFLRSKKIWINDRLMISCGIFF